MTKPLKPNTHIKPCVVYGIITRSGHLLPTTMAGTRRQVIDNALAMERRYYPGDTHSRTWAKTRKHWGYRIARIELGGPVYAA